MSQMGPLGNVNVPQNSKTTNFKSSIHKYIFAITQKTSILNMISLCVKKELVIRK